MNRILSPHQLPPLSEALPGFTGLRSDPTRSHALLECLRELVLKFRGTSKKRFYSGRELATFFKVDRTLVIRALAMLQDEGLVIRLRSSMTLMTGIDSKSRVVVKGVVGLPIWHYGYCLMSSWRKFLVTLEESLNQHGFVADIIFYNNHQTDVDILVDRLLKHHLDYVVWFKPNPVDYPAIPILQDHGVTPLVVRDTGARHISCAEYIIEWEATLAKTLAYWKKEGITVVECFLSWYQMPSIEKLIRESGLTPLLISNDKLNAHARGMKGYIQKLKPDPQHALITIEEWWTAFMMSEEKDAWLDLIRKRRILFRDNINLSPLSLSPLKNHRVDILSSGLDHLARKIALDIASGKLPPRGESIRHKSTFSPDVSLEEYALFF